MISLFRISQSEFSFDVKELTQSSRDLASVKFLRWVKNEVCLGFRLTPNTCEYFSFSPTQEVIDPVSAIPKIASRSASGRSSVTKQISSLFITNHPLLRLNEVVIWRGEIWKIGCICVVLAIVRFHVQCLLLPC